MNASPSLVLSAEHASNAVPLCYRHLFSGDPGVLKTHRAIDFGTAALAGTLTRRLGVPVYRATVTRLLVDCNRSPGHPRLFSEYTRDLSTEDRETLLELYYRPMRAGVAKAVRASLNDANLALHISLHSFTPQLNGKERSTDVGLLYDPTRDLERTFCRDWQAALRAAGLRVRRNYPYRGVSDGHVTALRRESGDSPYAGIELEINQAIVTGSPRRWSALQNLCAATLDECAKSFAND